MRTFTSKRSHTAASPKSSPFLCLWILILPVVFMAGCGSSGSSNQNAKINVQVSISPTAASVFSNQSATFTATVIGTSDTTVGWSVQEGSAGGVITSAGLYTAPATAGTFHVIATSHADSSKTAVATVTVTGPPPAPNFTSTPGTSASEGQTYSYTVTATDPAGGSVSFQLTSGPTNASLSGNVLTWMPTHPQSRTSNSFTITATTTEHATATQVFSVTPNGNINGELNYISYTTNGKLVTPVSSVKGVVAFVPDGKGSYTQVAGTLSSGSFTIPNVPAGYFMLQISIGQFLNELVWTNSSDVDFSQPYQGRLDTTSSTKIPTLNVDFNIATNNPLARCYLFVPNLGSFVFIDETNFITCQSEWKGSYDWQNALVEPNKGDQTYVYADQAVPSLLNGTWTGYSLSNFAGPFDLAIPDDGSANLTGSMPAQSVNASVRANLAISQLAPLAGGVSPNLSASPLFSVNVQPFTADYYLNLGAISDVTDNSTISPLVLYPFSPSFNIDADLGDVSYANPFPASWPMYAYLRLLGQLSYTADGATDPLPFWAGVGTLSLNMPTSGSPIAPLVGPASSIKINGQDFFQDQPNAGAQPVVSWNPPSVGAPDGYTLNIIQLTKLHTFTNTGNIYTIYTTQNSITVPAGILQSGYAYVFQLQAFKGNGNVEKAPLYSAFPWGYADAFSGTVHAGQ